MVFQIIQQVLNPAERSCMGLFGAVLKVVDLVTTIIMIVSLDGIYSMATGNCFFLSQDFIDGHNVFIYGFSVLVALGFILDALIAFAGDKRCTWGGPTRSWKLGCVTREPSEWFELLSVPLEEIPMIVLTFLLLLFYLSVADKVETDATTISEMSTAVPDWTSPWNTQGPFHDLTCPADKAPSTLTLSCYIDCAHDQFPASHFMQADAGCPSHSAWDKWLAMGCERPKGLKVMTDTEVQACDDEFDRTNSELGNKTKTCEGNTAIGTQIVEEAGASIIISAITTGVNIVLLFSSFCCCSGKRREVGWRTNLGFGGDKE